MAGYFTFCQIIGDDLFLQKNLADKPAHSPSSQRPASEGFQDRRRTFGNRQRHERIRQDLRNLFFVIKDVNIETKQ